MSDQCQRCGKPKCSLPVYICSVQHSNVFQNRHFSCHGHADEQPFVPSSAEIHRHLDRKLRDEQPQPAEASVPVDLTALIEEVREATEFFHAERDEIVLALRVLRVLRHLSRPIIWLELDGSVTMAQQTTPVSLNTAERRLGTGGGDDV